jgi:phosphatidylglycerophosphate synthase
MSSKPTTPTAVAEPASPRDERTTASIREMREVCQLRRPNAKGKTVWAGHWFNSLFTRYISIYFTWLFVRLGISANATTFLMIPTGLLGVAFLVPHVLWANLLGCALLLFGVVLDCVDGEVARWTRKSSVKGFYLDYVYHVICNSPVYALCALHLYAWYGDTKYLILAFVAYAAASSALSLGIVFHLVQTRIPASLTPVPAASRRVLRNPIAVLKWWVGLFLFDRMITDWAVMVSILLTYVGLAWPIFLLAWALPGVSLFFVVAQTSYRYFDKIPDAVHQKSAV